jgi:hypothetical protein
MSLRDFLKDFIPPHYLIDGILQRRFVYAFTGQTGHAKTALALLIGQLVGGATAAMLGGHEVEQGSVVYFAGENPDDIRMRLIGANVDLDTRISVIPGIFDIEALRERLVEEITRVGPIDLVVIDTSAAYFLGEDENSNPQMGAHARMLRKLTTLPGGPCVLVLCHPIKNVNDPAQLLPRGGGAFLAEMDGNLTVWKRDDDTVELHHTKIRGPGFEILTFKLEKITSTKLVDTKGRLVPTVKAVVISEAEEKERSQGARADEDQLLAALAEDSDRSLACLARACGWIWQSGEPAKSRVERVLGRLHKAKLVMQVRGRWELTKEGEKEAPSAKGNKKTGNGSGDPLPTQPFHPIVGQHLDGIECVYCGKAHNVFRIRDGRVSNGKGEALHKNCAEAWFMGEFWTNGQG